MDPTLIKYYELYSMTICGFSRIRGRGDNCLRLRTASYDRERQIAIQRKFRCRSYRSQLSVGERFKLM